jgi:hypothetical protein
LRGEEKFAEENLQNRLTMSTVYHFDAFFPDFSGVIRDFYKILATFTRQNLMG